jgi:hypothetical protein
MTLHKYSSGVYLLHCKRWRFIFDTHAFYTLSRFSDDVGSVWSFGPLHVVRLRG